MKKSTVVASALGLVAVLAAWAVAPSAAAQTASPAPRAETGSRAYLHSFNLPAHGVAMEGYSPVSYFAGRAERGSPLFAVEHRGVTYHLTSTAQVAEFRRDPAKYEPAFGGWCALGMAVQDKFPVDPTRFKIVDGQILLFLVNENVDALDVWNGKDEAELMKAARVHWKKVQG